MSTSTFTVAAPVQGSQDWTQWYYRGAACVMLVAVLVGFQQFFLHGKAHPGRELTPQIRTLIIAHGIAMTGWVLTFVTQTFLIAAGRRRAHRTLGRMAAVLATSRPCSCLRDFSLSPSTIEAGRRYTVR